MAPWPGVRAVLLPLALLAFLSPAPLVHCHGDRFRLQFTQPLYHAAVYENSAARTYAVSQVRMGVPLLQRSWEVRFRITAGDDEGFFKAEEYTLGDFCFLRIRTKGGNAAILNREIQDNYQLTVKASIKGDTLEAWTKVSVQVLDMNDLRPLFSPTTYSVTIAENTPLRTSIAQVTATDADTGSNGEFYYFFKDRVDLFAVHPTSGIVSLSGKLDIDVQSRYDLEIQAVDRGMKLYGNNGVSSTAKLFVHVERINEHAPEIHVASLAPIWAEKTPAVAVVTVSDADEGLNGEIEDLSIIAGDPLDLFSIERPDVGSMEEGDSGEFIIRAPENLDWESYPFGLNLSLQARDRGMPQKFSTVQVVHLKLSRPTPAEVRFQKDAYEVSLTEVAPPGTVLVAVKLQPEPDDAEYILTPSADSAFFNINTMTGVISTSRWLTKITQQVFELEVMEVDSELRVNVRVSLEDANDNAPIFAQQSYEVFVNESVGIGTTIVTVAASDADHGENGYITYSMASLTPLPFAVHQFSGAVTTTQELDFESSSESFSFVVRASDWGSPYRRETEVNVTVHLENVNDNQPLFEKVDCVGVVSRELPVGEVITTMSAIDIDELELVKYKILSGNEHSFFDLNPDSGVMTLRRSLAVANPKNSFSLKITATDGETFSDPMFVNISVVQGKSPPKSFSCKETRVAQRLAEKLLRKAKANSKPKIEEGFIDLFSVNRQTPQFDKAFPIDITIREDLDVGTSVFQVKAYDGDTGFNGQVLHAISSGNTDSSFTIGTFSGVISIFLPLDRERTDRYLLNLTLYDLGQPQRSAWRLLTVYVEDANDNFPQFLQDGGYQARIPENTPIGTEVIQVEATDKDQGLNGEIQYSLLTSTSQFGINSTNGIVYVAGQLDRENVPSFVLKVEARDKADRTAQRFTITTLSISLEDVNDCAPAFIPSVVSARALEDLPLGTVIAWLDTQDPDLGPGGEVRYSLASDYDGRFEVDKVSGAIRLTKELDYETQQFFNLTVRAKDRGRPVSLLSVSFVELEVVDVNENLYAPYFSNFALNGSVKESVRIGTSVLQVSAQDDDTGRDGEVQYSIRDGSGLGRFTIDEETGMFSEDCCVFNELLIYVISMLINFLPSLIRLAHCIVTVSDGGPSPRHTTVWVVIQVLDVNDNKPVFPEKLYQVRLPERGRKQRGGPIYRVFAYDADQGANAELSYSIVDGNEDGKFYIDPKTGVVSSPKKQFSAGTYDILTVCRFMGLLLCENMGLQSSVLYCLIGNTGSTFRIDPVLGIISVARELDLSTIGHYVLTVKAMDNGSPALSATAAVRIAVTLSDNAPPKFPQSEYQTEVAEGVAIGTSVTTVNALSLSTLTYDIRHGNSGRTFRINQYSGVITTQKPLDFETVSSYVLTITASNMAGQSSNATVTVAVLDQNDNSPVFQQVRYQGSISEGAGLNSVVLSETGEPLVIRATDADRNHNALLVYQIQEETARRFFAVDAGTGSIRTIAQLDHETTPTFRFHVSVRDSGRPQLSAERPAEVTVQVRDINDCPPQFSQDSYEAVLLLPTYEGVEALRVSAYDPDGDGQSELAYSLTDGSLEHFAMEPDTGLLTVRNSTFSKDRFRFNIRVSDGRFSSTALVTVLVREALDSGLAFTHSVYNANIQENNGNMTTVAVVTALGNRLNEPLRYSLLNAGGKFRIRPTSGAIETVGVPLDREEKEEYGLLVQAGREEDRLRVARALVRVRVTDVNDNAPVFVGLPYYAAVQVEAEPGASIFRVTAVDRDKGLNGEVSYFLQDELGHFEMDRISGELRLRRAFEADLSSVEYQVLVFARDGGTPPLSSSVTFPVTVVNRAMPVFDRPFYSVKVSEDVPVLTPILGINASSPEGQSVLYTITHGDPGTLFSIGYDTGVISVTAPLDYETNPAHRLIVRATDCLTGARAEVDVEVMVLDVNDNAPVFEQPVYNAVISEAAMIGTPALQVQALDSDSEKNAAVRYQIIPDRSNSTDHFHIDSSSGLILTARSLDHESVERYIFVVKATDNGFPPLSSEVRVIVQVMDTNDNAPVFNQLLYEASVNELAPRGHFVTCVQASDADRSDTDRLRYGLVSGNERMLFELDAASGVLTLSGQRRTQRMPSTFSLNVSVSDGVFTSTAQVHVRVERANLHSPQFTLSMYEAEVRENMPAGSKVIMIRAQDADPGPFGEVRYILLSDTARDLFSIDSNGQIMTLEKMDREERSEVMLSVAAVDAGGRAGYCSVRVSLLDDNDNAPLFDASEYRASVRAEVASGSVVIQVQAWDADQGINGQISYSLYSEASLQVTELLDIDPDSGWIVTKGNFSPLQGSVLSFFVKASDGGSPVRHSLASVYVHVLSADAHLPIFSQPHFSFTVLEDTPIGSMLGAVHLQTPIGQSSLPVSFSAVIGHTAVANSDGVFVVDRESGMIKLDKPLDRERTPVFHFKVAATLQQGLVDAVSVVDVEVKILDINDNKPAFESDTYEASVNEGLPAGTRVLQVRAVDPDWAANGQVTYSLAPPGLLGSGSEDLEEGSFFTIDSSSGWISTLKGLDHEHSPAHSLTVWAYDLGDPASLSASTTVTIAVGDSNDNMPEFLQARYYGSVRESDAPGEVVAVLNTRDDDSSPGNRQVTYHITGGNRGGVFALGLVQSEWKLYVKRPLDREEQEHYLINVTATDGLHVATATVEVLVTDINDNSPVCDPAVYTASVSEDVPIGRLILRVKATDADAGSNAQIQYTLSGPGAEDFIIHPYTGELKTAVELDREKVALYSLVARATDGGGLWCDAAVAVTLLDVNDNPPQFSMSHYTTSVYENTATKALLTRLQAIDPDLGESRKVVYSLVDSADGFFSIDKSSGVVALERPMDREIQSLYVITVRASDQGVPLRLSSLTNLTITVLDINDNPPVFERRDYLATLPEDVAVATEVLRIYAASKDIGTNADIYYSIRSGNQQGHFTIDVHTGAISVSRPLDFESCKDYFLTVEARDGGTPPLSAVTMVNINLTDVNDNAPMFSRDIYSATISEDANIGDTVVKVTAEDVDSQVNGDILYSIINGDRENQFFVEPITGQIKVNKQLDRETIAGYALVVRALDSGTPAMSSTVVVNIDLADINDNPPTFTPANHTAVIQENKPIGTSILQLSVIDKDASHNGPPFHFRILSGNEGGWFKMDREGLLMSNQMFRRSEGTEYTIQVEARDSGRPPLSSTAVVSVRVIEESVHRPVASPLHVHIITMEDEFPGGVIGQIHATDQDTFDILTYGHTHQQNSLFKVSPRDGRIIALSGLDAGRYSLNATVSDGRFLVSVPVSVEVSEASAAMLREAVTVRFDRVDPHDFVHRYLPAVRRAIAVAMATPPSRPEALRVLSIQPVEATGQLDLLVAVEMPDGGGYYKAAFVSQKLSSARRQLDSVLRVSAVLDKNCSGLDCREAQCEQSITLDSHSLLTYSSPKTSFVSPRFHRSTRCVCNGSCSAVSEVCEDMACPGDMQCVKTDSNRGPYACQCPPGKLGECAGHTSLSFSGNSYIKYRIIDGGRREEMKLQLRIRTLQSKGIIMYTRPEPCTVLKIEDGRLWFQLDCDKGGPGVLGISSWPINDGNWHQVTLELGGNFSSLSLDDGSVLRRQAPPRFRPPGSDWSLFFGAQVLPPDARGLTERKAPRVSNGFQGCLDSIILNDNELPLQNKRSRYAEVVGLSELKLGCVLYPDACANQPCLNGATCVSLPSGGFSCSCSALHTGGRCETEISVCVPNPCQNGGVCKPIGNAFICSCKRGYTGITCDSDVNECESEQCENGGVCVNTFGSFYCNCTVGFVGRSCSVRPVLVPDMQAGHAYVGKEELIGIAVVLFLILTLILLFVAFRKKVFQKSYSRNNLSLVQDPATAALLHKANGGHFPPLQSAVGDPINLYTEGGGVIVGPPQVPVRPMAYTPCFPGDGSLEKRGGTRRGAELTEMSTFHPATATMTTESPRILGGATRRGVVVCSVAPNLPPSSPCRSECDSLRKSPWEEEGKVDMLEEVTCFSGSNKGSNSEVQSLSSFQSDSCDDNAYHWDTSDWLPSTRLPDIEEVPTYEGGEVGVALESDYYLGGFDIDSDYPPPQETEFMSQEQLAPPLPAEDYDDTSVSRPVSREATLRPRPHFHPSQYLPPHQLPLGPGGEVEFSTFVGGVERLSINTSSSASDDSAHCVFTHSETGGSLDSLDNAQMQPHTQQTEV
uniref:FAT atypical cadherin 3a n=1 Tax=Pygocentrus nattereri TaxID=42514 RepID=A0A3B4DCD8_PYGNA